MRRICSLVCCSAVALLASDGLVHGNPFGRGGIQRLGGGGGGGFQVWGGGGRSFGAVQMNSLRGVQQSGRTSVATIPLGGSGHHSGHGGHGSGIPILGRIPGGDIPTGGLGGVGPVGTTPTGAPGNTSSAGGTPGIKWPPIKQPHWPDESGRHPTSSNVIPWPIPNKGPTFGFPITPTTPSTPTWSTPRRDSTPTPTPQRDPPVTPEPNATPQAQLPPPATEPEENELKTEGRRISEKEVQAAKDFFQQRFKECAASIDSELPAVDCDWDKLMELLVAHGCAADIQIRLIDALRAGDCDLARRIWISILPKVDCPFHESRLRILFGGFCTKLYAGTCTHRDYIDLEQQFTAAGFAERRCCGAPSLLEDLEEFVTISDLMQQAEPVSAAQSQQQAAVAPTGQTAVIYHPRLPEGGVVVLNDEAVIVGTGGVGKLRTEQTTVAQAQGYATATGKALPHSDLPPVRSGILILNRAAGEVNFAIDKAKFSLRAGYRRRFAQDKVQIAFDRGSGRGTQRYNLTPGTYKFDYADGGWKLTSVPPYEVTIDNSNNPDAFHYIIQGEQATVGPYSKATRKSAYPPTIRFDRGNGRQMKQVLPYDTQSVVQVAVSPADNQWDLFEPAAAAVAASDSSPTPADPAFVPAF